MEECYKPATLLKVTLPWVFFRVFVIAHVIPNHATRHILRLYTGGDSGPSW